MATSEHLHSSGTKVEYSTNLVTPSYTEITDVVSVTVPGFTVGDSEDTQLQSTAATKEFGPGWVTTEDFEFDTYVKEAQDSTLLGLVRTKLKFQVTYPKLSTESSAGATVVFTGYFKGRKPAAGSVDSDDRYKQTWTVKVTGAVTLAAGS